MDWNGLDWRGWGWNGVVDSWEWKGEERKGKDGHQRTKQDVKTMTDNDTISTIRYRLEYHRAKAEFARNEARRQCEVATRESIRVVELEEMLRTAVMPSLGQNRNL